MCRLYIKSQHFKGVFLNQIRGISIFFNTSGGVRQQMKTLKPGKYDCLLLTQTLLTPNVISGGHSTEGTPGVI